MPYGLSKFCRFAVNVWEVNPAGKADEQVAREGLYLYGSLDERTGTYNESP